ncbi:retrotransposon hot spot (RHS) protein [Trypanosoma cruzi Dm28c]|uniref:Retrotransposon hot spot (RHS) protein n=1 Tax=Trypanosoma cruzi Dm28c TaxID=1416333 RepID=V5B117_TRYCR|nr:retrotransposon hot spot (RHS) protein [Trypanosoma cruzi Dm28c]
MSGRPEEGIYGNMESQSSNFSQGGRRRTRSEFEGDTDYSSTTRIRLEGIRRPQWTMSSTVEDILLGGSTNRAEMRLNEFIRSNLGEEWVVERNGNVIMEAFVQEPDAYVQDQQLLRRIINLPAYQVYKLHQEGVFFLRQWREYERKDTLTTLAKGKLNGVLTEIEIEEKERREEEERARREEQIKFNLTLSIEDAIFQGRARIYKMKLNRFLKMELDGRGVVDTNRSVLLKEFFKDPAKYIPDARVLNEIKTTNAYLSIEGVVREEMDKGEDVSKLKQAGVYNLQKWSEATAQVKESVHEITKSFLDAALQEANKPTMTTVVSIKMEGFYESVYNASWHHVVEVPGSEGMGLKVKEGNPPQSWTYREDGETFEKVDDVEQSGAERLRLMVLTSDKRWPYSWGWLKPIRDCYVNCEVERVWQIVKGDLTKWFSSHGGNYFKPKQRVLIGTPGIGKSMAAGSYLLYQLLQYDVKKLPVVVYVIADQKFLFDKTIKTVTQYPTDEMSRSVISSLWQRGMKGYVIYDVAKKGTPPATTFAPPQWGMIVLTSPNVDNFEEWRKQREAAPIIINCPDEMDVKAMCIWKGHNGQLEEEAEEQAREQAEKKAREQAKYWETVNERMDKVGPIPRCIFNELEYRIRLTAIGKTVKNINATNATDYMGVGRSKIWIAEYVSHTIVKFVRVRAVPGIEVGCNAPVSHSARVKITQRLTNMTPSVDVLNLLLRNFGCFLWVVFEYAGTAAFMNPHAVDIIQRNLTELHPEGRLTSRFSVLSNNPRGHPTRSITLKKLSGNPARINLEYGVLYQPAVGNFPLVDALFFMQSPRKTLFGLRMTTAGGPHTTTSTVRQFTECLAAYFEGWEELSRDMSWEIIYVQHTDSTPMNDWQRFDVDNSNNVGRAENREIAAFWEEEMHQYQVSISSEEFRMGEAL